MSATLSATASWETREWRLPSICDVYDVQRLSKTFSQSATHSEPESIWFLHIFLTTHRAVVFYRCTHTWETLGSQRIERSTCLRMAEAMRTNVALVKALSDMTRRARKLTVTQSLFVWGRFRQKNWVTVGGRKWWSHTWYKSTITLQVTVMFERAALAQTNIPND